MQQPKQQVLFRAPRKVVVRIRHVDCNDRTPNDTLQIEVLPSFETEKKE